ncbi:MAG: DUF2238 domain-containing protein [Verrucomicrobiales bacterium]
MAKISPAPRSAPASNSQVRGIAAVTLTYVVAASAYAISHGNREFVFYIVVMLVLMACVFVLHQRVGLSAAVLWCLSAWGLMHMAGGLVHVPGHWPTDNGSVLYNLWLIPGRLKYDQLVHAFGFGVTTWICWQALVAAIEAQTSVAPYPTLGLMILCAAGGMGFGALNEVVEFFATLCIPKTNVGGYTNTGWDLVANLLGSVVAATVIAIRYRPRERA